MRLVCLTENWLDIGFLFCKSIYVLIMSCVNELDEMQQEAVDEEVYEGKDHEFIEEDMGKESIDEGGEVVLENNYNGDIKY